MIDTLLSRGPELYGIVYFGAILSVALLESMAPARESGPAVGRRWLRNFSLSVLSTALVRLSFPLAGVAWAVFCAQRGWGLLGAWDVPVWMGITLTIIALDLTYYATTTCPTRSGGSGGSIASITAIWNTTSAPARASTRSRSSARRCS